MTDTDQKKTPDANVSQASLQRDALLIAAADALNGSLDAPRSVEEAEDQINSFKNDKDYRADVKAERLASPMEKLRQKIKTMQKDFKAAVADVTATPSNIKFMGDPIGEEIQWIAVEANPSNVVHIRDPGKEIKDLAESGFALTLPHMTALIKDRLPPSSHTLWFTHSVNVRVDFGPDSAKGTSDGVFDLDIPMPDFTSLPGFSAGLDSRDTLAAVIAEAVSEKYRRYIFGFGTSFVSRPGEVALQYIKNPSEEVQLSAIRKNTRGIQDASKTDAVFTVDRQNTKAIQDAQSAIETKVMDGARKDNSSPPDSADEVDTVDTQKNSINPSPVIFLSNPRLFLSLQRAEAFYAADLKNDRIDDREAFRFYLNTHTEKAIVKSSDPRAIKMIEESRNRKGDRGFIAEQSIVVHDGPTEFLRSPPFLFNADGPLDANGEAVDFIQESEILTIHPDFRPSISKVLSAALVADREINQPIVLRQVAQPPSSISLDAFKSGQTAWLDYVAQKKATILESQSSVEIAFFAGLVSQQSGYSETPDQRADLKPFGDKIKATTLTEASTFLIDAINRQKSLDPAFFSGATNRFGLPSPSVEHLFSVADLVENVSNRVFSDSKKFFHDGSIESLTKAREILNSLHQFFEPFSRSDSHAASLHKKYLASRALFFKNFFKDSIEAPVLKYKEALAAEKEIIVVNGVQLATARCGSLPIDDVPKAISDASKIMDFIVNPSYPAEREMDDLASIAHASLSELCRIISAESTMENLASSSSVRGFIDALNENSVLVPHNSQLDFALNSAIQKQEEDAEVLVLAKKWAPLGEAFGVPVVFKTRSELLRDPFAAELAKLNPPPPMMDALLEWLGRRDAFSDVNTQVEASREVRQSRVLLPLLSAMSKLIETVNESTKSVGGIFSKLSFRADSHLADRLADSFVDFQSAFKDYKDDAERSLAADKIWLDHASLPSSSFAALGREWSEWFTSQTKTPLPPSAESAPSDIAKRRRLNLSSSIMDALTQSTTAAVLLANEVAASVSAREDLLKRMLMINWGALGSFAAVIQVGKLAGAAHAQVGLLEAASAASGAALSDASSDEKTRQAVRDAFLEMTQSKDAMMSFQKTLENLRDGVLTPVGQSKASDTTNEDAISLSDHEADLSGAAQKAEAKRKQRQSAATPNAGNKI